MSHDAAPGRTVPSGRDGLWQRHRGSVAFVAILLVLAAHTLRNVSTVGYFAAYALAALGSVVAFVRSPWRRRLADRGGVLAVWVGLALWAACTTLVVSGVGPAANGLIRFLFAAPIFLALAGLTRDRAQLIRHAVAILVVFGLQAWTLPAQLVTGPWPFFATASVRAGETRYASAVGSITAIGIIVGCYLVLCQLVPRRWRWAAVVALLVPALVSLSKAALINVALALALLVWLNRRHVRFLLTGLAGLLTAALAVAVLAPSLLTRVGKLLLSFGVGQAATDDQGVGASGADRLSILPAQNWAKLLELGSPLAPLTGGGYAFGDSALVGPHGGVGAMAHNQYIECLTVFGLVGGLLLIGLLALCGLACARAARRTGDPLYRTATAAWVLLAVNSATANGTLYQPAAGILLSLLLFISVAAPVVAQAPLEDPHGPARPAARAAASLADRAARVRDRRRGRPARGEAPAVVG